MTENVILETQGITKQFPGVRALDNVSFSLRRGEVHALVGENGAGKSTLMQILNGVYKADAGQILLDGQPIKIHDPMHALHLGIGIVFQELSLTSELTVAENIFPNRQPTRAGFLRKKELYARAQQIIDIFHEDIDPAMPVKHLTIAKQQMVEIMKAVSHDPKVLILDEPTSSLTQTETVQLFNNIRELKKHGISIIYISHHLSELFQVADRVTVLRDGKVIDTLDVSEVDEGRLVGLMVGRQVKYEHIDRSRNIDYGRTILEVKNLTHRYFFRDVSFKVCAGEIVGMSGLIGAGRSEVAKCIFGLDKAVGGEVWLEGKQVHIRDVADAKRYGIAYASENRKLDGLFLSNSIKDNCTVTQLKSFENKIGFLNEKQMSEFAKMCIEKFNVATPGEKQLLRNLSGGNQQKVLLSMWLGIEPKLLIVDEPTKGVDVGAKAEIYTILRALADTGIGIVVISSDLLEVLSISDSILILKDGRVVCSMENKAMTEEILISYATGHKA